MHSCFFCRWARQGAWGILGGRRRGRGLPRKRDRVKVHGAANASGGFRAFNAPRQKKENFRRGTRVCVVELHGREEPAEKNWAKTRRRAQNGLAKQRAQGKPPVKAVVLHLKHKPHVVPAPQKPNEPPGVVVPAVDQVLVRHARVRLVMLKQSALRHARKPRAEDGWRDADVLRALGDNVAVVGKDCLRAAHAHWNGKQRGQEEEKKLVSKPKFH